MSLASLFCWRRIAGVGAGLAPALQASNPELSNALKEKDRPSVSASVNRVLRNALVVAQICGLYVVADCAQVCSVRNLAARRNARYGHEYRECPLSGDRIESKSGRAARLLSGEIDLRRQLAERLCRATPRRRLSKLRPIDSRYPAAWKNTTMTLPGQSADHPFEVRFNFVSADYF